MSYKPVQGFLVRNLQLTYLESKNISYLQCSCVCLIAILQQSETILLECEGFFDKMLILHQEVETLSAIMKILLPDTHQSVNGISIADKAVFAHRFNCHWFEYLLESNFHI